MPQYSVPAGNGSAEICAAWSDLETAIRSPIEHFAWWQACIDGLPRLGQLRPYLIEAHGKCCAIAPLVVRPGLVPRLEAIGVREIFEPMDFVYANRYALATLCDELARQKLPINLPRVPCDSPLLDELRLAFKNHGLVWVNICNPYPVLELDPSWSNPESHFNAGRRSDFRRAISHAEKSGPVAFEVLVPQPSNLRGLLCEAYDVELQCWKGSKGTALAIDPLRADFYRRYFDNCCANGTLRLAFMRVAGQAIAMQIAVQTDNRLWLLKIGYNEAHARSSPGTLLMLQVARHAALNGIRSIEFLGSVAPWTRMWTTRLRECMRIRVYPWGLLGAAAFASDAAKWATKRLRRGVRHVK